MASGRLLKNQISLSEQVNDLSIHSALLFTWMIAHADDFGRMNGNPRKVKAQVVPMRDDFTSDIVDRCLAEIASAKLIQLYEIEGNIYIQFPSWERHQSGLHKRTKSKFPDPPDGNFPGNSGKFLPEQELEQNRTEQENSICAQPEPSTSNVVEINPKKDAPPYQQIIDLYHETLKQLPKVYKLTSARKQRIRSLWADELDSLNSWRNYFSFISQSTFLMGRAPPGRDGRVWMADFDFIISPQNFVKIAEKKYHGKR